MKNWKKLKMTNTLLDGSKMSEIYAHTVLASKFEGNIGV
ncbi:hypothetical protein LINPERHAP2_LOCUS44217 [Linum perenne]